MDMCVCSMWEQEAMALRAAARNPQKKLCFPQLWKSAPVAKKAFDLHHGSTDIMLG